MDTQSVIGKSGFESVFKVDDANTIVVDAKRFLKELRWVTASLGGKHGQRAILGFVHVRIFDDSLSLETTNSHTMQNVTIPAIVPVKMSGNSFLISGEFAKDFSKTPTKHGKQVAIIPSGVDNNSSQKITYVTNEEWLEDEVSELTSNYPDLEMMVPINDGIKASFSIEQKDLVPVLREIKKQSHKAPYTTHITVTSDGKCLIGKDKKNAVEELKIDPERQLIKPRQQGNEFEIDFDSKLLIKLLQHTSKREKLTFEFYGSIRPIMMRLENNDYAIIAPVRTFN